MRTLIAVMLLACLTCCATRADAYIPSDPALINTQPKWAQAADKGITAWSDGTYIYAVGFAEKMEDDTHQKIVAVYLGQANILLAKGLRFAVLKDVALMRTWRSDSGALYILIRILPENIISYE